MSNTAENMDLFNEAMLIAKNSSKSFTEKNGITHYLNLTILSKPDESGVQAEYSLWMGAPLRDGKRAIENALISKSQAELDEIVAENRIKLIIRSAVTGTKEVANV